MDKTTDTGIVNFKLSQVDTAFSSRSYDVFSCLDSIEAKHKAFEKNQFDDRSDLLKPDPTDEPVARKTKFKIPKGMPRKSRLPDYKLRPDKWKTYSLLDISPEQMSDLSNQTTALEFIESLKNRATGSCPDATNQMEDDSMDTCTDTDTEISQSCFASHKQHLFHKPAVQSLKQTKVDENQLEVKAASQTVEVGPKLWRQQTKDESEEASSESVDDNLSEDAESSVDDTLRQSTKAESLEVHFQNKGVKCKNKHIRPRILAEENDEDNDSLAPKDKDSQEAKHADDESCKNDSDESDEFSDYAIENSDSDEEPSGLVESEHYVNNSSDLHYEHDNSNDGDAINSNSCFKGHEDVKMQNFEKDDDCTDDLDTVD